MRLFVEPMDATVVEVSPDGQVRFAGADEGWHRPTFQERRAMMYAAEHEIAALNELIDALADRVPGAR